jgi:hypothetical protein
MPVNEMNQQSVVHLSVPLQALPRQERESLNESYGDASAVWDHQVAMNLPVAT